MLRPAVLMLCLVAACGGDPDPVAPDLSVEAAGPHQVGTRRVVATDGARQREVTMQVWYPTSATAAAFAIEELEDEPNRAAYAGLLATADPACATRQVTAARDGAPAGSGLPLLLFSHCHECTRFSSVTVAQRLASHGFVVLAVEHTGNTLWNQLAGDGLALDTTTLDLRVGDLEFAAAHLSADPALAEIAAMVDLTRIGTFGHSFGSVTAGLYAQRHPVGAAFGLAAPMENPLLPGVTVASITAPLGFLVAQEDNSITELGNGLIRDNFTKATGPAWKIEVADAGHWSVSDLVGVVDGFAPGCGAGERQTDGQPFTYLDAATGRGIAAAYVTAFFKANLQGDAGAAAYLGTARPTPTVTVETHD
jgi:dienelactone hydrolase